MHDDSAHRLEVTREALSILWLQQLSAYYRASRSPGLPGEGRSEAGREATSVINTGMLSEHRGR
jgi:hypothetical protein